MSWFPLTWALAVAASALQVRRLLAPFKFWSLCEDKKIP